MSEETETAPLPIARPVQKKRRYREDKEPKDYFAWAIALAPLVATVISLPLTLLPSGGLLASVSLVVVSSILVHLDATRTFPNQSHRPQWGHWILVLVLWVVTVPMYLFARSDRLEKPQYPLMAWVVSLAFLVVTSILLSILVAIMRSEA